MLTLFVALVSSSSFFQPHDEKSFVSWMRRTNQLFTGDEYQARFGIWMANQRFVQEHNSKSRSFRLSMNKFAALTPSEYKSLLGFKPHKISEAFGGYSRNAKSKKSSSAASLDWRDKGAVNPVQDQGQCGSCWAFSAIQNCESAEFLKYATLYKFSEQSLVDCSTQDSGCSGGLPVNSFEFIINKCDGKVMLDADYPYTAVDGSCHFDASKALGHFSEYLEITSGDEQDLAAKCEQYGPVSIGIDASHFSFQLYAGGIYDDPSCSSYLLDHGVGLVGFGQEAEKPYWIVRNSWGSSWGEKGYIRMIRGNNQCGEATSATVILSK